MSAYNTTQYPPQRLQAPLAHYGAPQQQAPPATVMSPMMVHTPYSCEHDLVPSNSEVASQCLGSSLPKDGDLSATYGSQRHRSASNLGSPQNSRVGGAAAAPSFDASWNGSQYEEQQAPIVSSSFQQRPRGNSRMSNNSGSGSSSFNGSGNSHPRSSASAGSASPAPIGAAAHHQQPFPAFMMRAPIVNAPVHSAYLGGKCEYLEMPQGPGAEIATAAQWNRTHKVFIGHVKFEISADGLRWIIYMLTGVQAGKVEVRGMGCFMVFFANAEDVFRVRGLHKRVLFDTQGIWFAQNLEQEQTLHSYASSVAPSVHAKLPKGLMVVDEETSRRRNRKHKSAADKKLQAAYGEEQKKTMPEAQPSAGQFQAHILSPSAAAAAVQHESAQDLWASGAQFQGSRMSSAEDEYCS